MNIWNGIGAYPEGSPATVASIGNYDGVHLGHQTILRQAVADANERKTSSLLITFEPHPVTVLAPERRPKLLQTRRQKIDRLRETGLTDLLFLEFDQALAAVSGVDFFDGLLTPRIAFAAIHVGENFRFGHDRQGDLELLRKLGGRLGFEVHGVSAVREGERTISSSAIRGALGEGDVEAARRMLGRPHAVTGEVVRGEGRGRQLQTPTANLDLDNEMLPKSGVYITETVALASRFPSVTNVGYRPTVGGDGLKVETHLLEFDENLYGERVQVRFLARLRDECRFDGLPELADQLARDRAAAESFFQNQRLRVR